MVSIEGRPQGCPLGAWWWRNRIRQRLSRPLDPEEAAAKAAGIKFVHLPLNGAALDPAVADRFIVPAETTPQPCYLLRSDDCS